MRLQFSLSDCIAVVCLIMFSSSVMAQQKAQGFSFLAGGALELGGDQVAKVYFTNGEDQSVNAGQGGSILVGLDYAFNDKFSLRSVLGYKYVTTAATNANITLTRFPMRLSGVVHFTPKWWASAGYATQQRIVFKGDGIIDNFKLSTSGGAHVELGYNNIFLNYTGMKYKDNLSGTYNASCFGVGFLLQLKKKTKTVVMQAPLSQ
jgi:hypothetical protein